MRLVDLGVDDEPAAGQFLVRLVVVLVDILGLVGLGERLDLGQYGFVVSFQLLDEPFRDLFLFLAVCEYH